MRLLSLLFIIILGLSAVLSACGTTTPTPTVPTALTFGQMADTGKAVFASRCAGCHGTDGQGGRAPNLTGAAAALQKYQTAKGLLDYVSSAMPINAPASLSALEYQQLASYLLVQDQFVTAGTSFDAGRLDSIKLSK